MKPRQEGSRGGAKAPSPREFASLGCVLVSATVSSFCTAGESAGPPPRTSMPASSAMRDFDFGWFERHLLDEVLPKWLEKSVTAEGLFLPHFDRRWRPKDRGFGTLVSQSRLLYNFCKGYELTGREEYRGAVEKGARFLLQNFRDREHGGWFWAVTRDGEVTDSRKSSYGHAFAVFGLSHAAAATGNEEFKAAALQTWRLMQERFFDEHGGVIQEMTRDFKQVAGPRSQNPMMHLFEALLALGDLEGAGHVHKDAARIADFVLRRVTGPGCLPEMFTRDWRSLPAGKGRIEIGHAFEWAYLLSTAAERGLGEKYASSAAEFIEYGMRIGYDPEEGGIFSVAMHDGKVVSKTKGWWQQCEAARAMMHFAVRRGREELLGPLQKTTLFIESRLVDPEFGGWFLVPQPSPRPNGADKGNEWKVDYHVVGMCVEAMRLGRELGVLDRAR